VSFNAPASPTGIGLAFQTQQISGAFAYRFYAWTGAYTPNWNQNSETVIMEVSVSGGAGNGDFELVNSEGLVNSNDPNFYVESPAGLTGGYSNTLYKPVASGVPLPVRLAAFTGRVSGGRVNLNWSSEYESGNACFEIQRSCDGASWTGIGFVPGVGKAADYHFEDAAYMPCAESTRDRIIYYRLKQIDVDGNFELSQICAVRISDIERGMPYPNPVRQGEIVTLPISLEGRVDVAIYDMQGRKAARSFHLSASAGLLDIPTAGLPHGAYLLVVSAGGLREWRYVFSLIY